ncbi:MAG: hypothetical protein MJ106_02300 [Lentisphaeria bacterium]|nr:hypothetical protein [Lentisphaeria bacterium]
MASLLQNAPLDFLQNAPRLRHRTSAAPQAVRRVSGSTGVHAAQLAPTGAVRAAGCTRRRQYAASAAKAIEGP